ARHACPDPGLAAVEERRQTRLRDRFVQGVAGMIVRIERLHRRVELEALDAEMLDQAPRLAHAHLAARRVDARERDADVRMFGSRLRHLLLRGAPPAPAALL